MLFEKSKHNIKNQNRIILISLVVIYYFTYKLVIYTGGTKNVYPHFMYFPIILSAVYYGILGGILGGVLGGFLMGIIPVDVINNELQSIKTYSFRTIVFVIIGIFVAYLFKRLEKQYKKDPITSLPNRVALLERLSDDIKDNGSKFLAVIYIENIIEIFNIIGHSKTDLILNSISEYFNNIIKNKNVRIFNSHSLKFEFIIYETHRQLEKSLDTLEKYLQNTSLCIEDQYIFLRLKVGISEIVNKKNPEEIVNEAYKAVEFGLESDEKILFYHEAYSKNLLITNLISEIDRAIKNEELFLEYQPKLNLKNNTIEEVEALIRWKHPEKGIVPPNDFIPKLEKTDNIKKLTLWVINRCIKDIKIWDNMGINLNVSINITPRDLKDKNFSKNLIELFSESKIAYDRINLELTETDMVREMKDIIESLFHLREKGIKISIDDFGTGYSSLSYINSLPIDYVKIDRSFLKNLLDSNKREHLLKDTVQLLHNLDKIIVAEGVEDIETLNRIRELGCEEVQGYFISKPLKKEELENYINNFHLEHSLNFC